MISIIICSRNNNINHELTENIDDTIGVEYENIIIDNSKNEYSIFSAYNLGVKQAKFPILCFMHEDILFHTQNWGEKVIDHFENCKVGIIGVAGSHYLPKMPGSWWSSIYSSINVIHSINGKTEHIQWNCSKSGNSSYNAVLLDGLWMCIPKTIMNQIAFDDKNFNGFHCYDSDICLQIKKLNYEVRIVNNILIEHFSGGKKDRSYLKNIFIFYEKWKKELPLSVVEVPNRIISQANYFNARQILEEIKLNKFGLFFALITWKYYLLSNPLINRMNWILFMVLIKKIYLPEPLKSLKVFNFDNFD